MKLSEMKIDEADTRKELAGAKEKTTLMINHLSSCSNSLMTWKGIVKDVFPCTFLSITSSVILEKTSTNCYVEEHNVRKLSKQVLLKLCHLINLN